MQYKVNNFLEYLKVKFSTNFEKEIKYFFIRNKDLILDRFADANYVTEIDVSEMTFKNVWIEDSPKTSIEFDVAIEVMVDATINFGRHHDYETLSTHFWVLVSCYGDLADKFKTFKIIEVDEFNKTKPKKPLSGDLVPIMYRGQFSECAENILRKYY